MGEINIPRDQQTAITAIDARELDRLIDQAIREERSGELHRLPLAACGSHIGTKLHSFDRALAKHREAKAPRKRAETGDALRRAGHDLSFAVGAMKQRLETEQKDAQLFIVDDQIVPPYRFTTQMSVRVSYRWRRTIEDEWGETPEGFPLRSLVQTSLRDVGPVTFPAYSDSSSALRSLAEARSLDLDALVAASAAGDLRSLIAPPEGDESTTGEEDDGREPPTVVRPRIGWMHS